MTGPNMKRHAKSLDGQKAIEGFLDWCEEKGIVVDFYPDDGQHYKIDDMKPSRLIAKHYKINLSALDRERRQVLEAQRKANK